jgi:hypothetical protein
VAVVEPVSAGLPVRRVAEVDAPKPDATWVVRDLWLDASVGIIGGPPKCCKSWLGLDLAVSIASATPALGRFEVQAAGPALVFLAEDALSSVRERVGGLCHHRGLDLDALDLHVVTAPAVRLDLEADRDRLAATVEALRPRFLLLDPLVRLHRIDENSSGDVSALLSFLRELSRGYDLAIAVTHHMSKNKRAQLGQSLRGSGDLHAWGDSNAYLTRVREGLRLTLEHRSAPSPEPFALALAGGDQAPHLELREGSAEPTSLSLPEQVKRALAEAAEPVPRSRLRATLKVNNQRLGDVLEHLEVIGAIERTRDGWRPAIG